MENETIPAGKFKAQCLKLMDEVSEGKRSIIVTKHGKPMVRIVPVAKDKRPELPKAGFMKGNILYQDDDIISPMTELWNLPE